MAVKPGTWDKYPLRVYLYMEMRRRFGPQDIWKSNRPSEYRNFCIEMAKFFTELTGQKFTWGAVRNQIEFALNNQDTMTQSHFKTWVDNVIAAREAGIIRNFPEIILK